MYIRSYCKDAEIFFCRIGLLRRVAGSSRPEGGLRPAGGHTDV